MNDDKIVYVYVFEIKNIDYEWNPVTYNIFNFGMPEVNPYQFVKKITNVSTTVIATIRENKTTVRVIIPSDDSEVSQYSIIPALRNNGFKLEIVK